MSDGWCPFAVKRKLDFDNFFPGRWGWKARAVCLHIAAGPLTAVFPTFNHDGAASAHFAIGKNGVIEQYVSIDDAAFGNGLFWSNGQWFSPNPLHRRLENPSWPDLVSGVNPNLYTISIEHEGQPAERWTDAMYDANNRLLTWIGQQTGITYVPFRTLVGHYAIDPLDRPNCPGPNVEYERMAADANSALLAPEIVQAAQAAASALKLLVINPDGALYKFALSKGLGYPQTDEYRFTVQGTTYIGQVFLLGIAYVAKDDYGNIRAAKKAPGGFELSSDPVAARAETAGTKLDWLVINPATALYNFAQAHQLGFPQTDEFPFSAGGSSFVGQVYEKSIVCVKLGDFGNVKVVPKL